DANATIGIAKNLRDLPAYERLVNVFRLEPTQGDIEGNTELPGRTERTNPVRVPEVRIDDIQPLRSLQLGQPVANRAVQPEAVQVFEVLRQVQHRQVLYSEAAELVVRLLCPTRQRCNTRTVWYWLEGRN